MNANNEDRIHHKVSKAQRKILICHPERKRRDCLRGLHARRIYLTITLEACGPFGPWLISNSTS